MGRYLVKTGCITCDYLRPEAFGRKPLPEQIDDWHELHRMLESMRETFFVELCTRIKAMGIAPVELCVFLSAWEEVTNFDRYLRSTKFRSPKDHVALVTQQCTSCNMLLTAIQKVMRQRQYLLALKG